MWIRLIYQAALSAGLIACAPFALYSRWKSGKNIQSLWQRFGSDIPSIPREGGPLIWLHAVSVGETRAIVPLAKLLLKHPSKPRIVISSITDTGHQEAKRLLPEALCHIVLPFDLSSCMRKLFTKIQPNLVILCEGDFWLNFLSQARAQGADLIVVNGKLSTSSAKRYAFFHSFGKTLFSPFSLFCLQTKEYQERFIQMEVGIPPSILKVVGNMKFEMPPQSLTATQKAALYETFALSPEKPVVVIGSTHDPEEALMLDLCIKIWKTLPNCQFILAPRHPERCKEVAALIEARKIPYLRYSHLKQQRADTAAQLNTSSNPQQSTQPTDAPHLILVDQVGHLRESYAIADVAIVAGSFVERVGGHNILEPALYGTPILFGPHMWGQKELERAVLQAQAGSQVTNETLYSTLLNLLTDSEERKRMGSAGYQLLQQQSGSTERTLEHILPFLDRASNLKTSGATS